MLDRPSLNHCYQSRLGQAWNEMGGRRCTSLAHGTKDCDALATRDPIRWVQGFRLGEKK